jgi:hypothetical protein
MRKSLTQLKRPPHRNSTKRYAAIAISWSSHLPSKEFSEREYTLGPASAVPSYKVSTMREDFDGF